MHFDTIVLGVGGIGSAVLEQLAGRGQAVLGIDAFTPPHHRGSSHGETRVIRTAYFEHPDYVPLAQAAFRRWRDLELSAEHPLLHPVGLVQVGPPNGEVISGLQRAAERHRLLLDELDADQFRQRFHPLRCSQQQLGLFEHQAGYLLVEACVAAQIASAQRSGACCVFGERVMDWEVRDDPPQVVVRTTQQKFHAHCLVLTLGAGNRELARLPSPALTVLRKQVYWYEFPSQVKERFSELPVYLFENPTGVFYGFPSLDGNTIKVARHSGGAMLAGDVLAEECNGDDADRELVREFLTENFDGVNFRLRHQQSCLYTMTPDQHFRVGRHPAYEQVYLAAGLSGHGFKFAPVLGAALADLVIDGCTQFPVDFLRP